MKRKIFFLSGLGADKRAFDALDLHFIDIVTHIDWLIPQPKESLQQYAQRIIHKYHISKSDILVGLSFGGLMAVEIKQLLENDQIILISSTSNKNETHPFMRAIGALGLHRLIPKSKLNRPNMFIYKGFGIKNKKDKLLLDGIFKDTNVDFAYWALHHMSKWKVKLRANGIIKIHGDNDLIIPINNTEADYTINRGGHFMVVDRAQEISTILNSIL